MAIAIPRVLPTTYPIAQLISDIAQALPSFLSPTDDTYDIVDVYKLNARNEPRVIHRRNLATKKMEVLGPVFSYIENKHTGRLYLNEPTCVIAMKCACIVFAAPVYTLCTMLWNAYQIFRSVALIAYNVYVEAERDFSLQRYYEATIILNHHIQPLPEIIKERFFEIIKAPLFGVMLQIAALSGIVKPLHGREIVGNIESAWHQGATYKDGKLKRDGQYKGKQVGELTLMEELHSGREVFLANCCLSRGNLNTDRQKFRVLNRRPLQPYFGASV